MFQDNKRTEISSLGEFGLIKHLQQFVTLHHPESIKGIGDDCAVTDLGNNRVLLTTTDLLTEGVHFDLSYCPLKHLGYKAVVVNLSDIYAMNGTPKQIVVGIALSSRFSLEAVEELYQGMLLACNRYGVDLVGGDTTSSKSGLTISITATGYADKDKVVYRNTAQEKDILMVSGDLGAAYMGLQLLEREKAVFVDNPQIQPDLDGNDYVLERQLKPEARVDVIQLLADTGVVPTSMIDISDGLASEIKHLCEQSNLGCYLHEDKIPIDSTTYQLARNFDLDPTLCALSGGEDYELLFTIKQSDYAKLENNPLLTPIGYMMESAAGCQMIDKQGGMHPLQAQGWDGIK